jgi:4-hydroxy-tetrahydrodipicolinate synthase
MAVGARGAISVAANVAPRQIAAAIKLSLINNHDRAREIYRRMWPVLTEIASEVNPLPIKCALSLMGLIGEYYRLPLLPLPEAKRGRLRQALITCGLLDSDSECKQFNKGSEQHADY